MQLFLGGPENAGPVWDDLEALRLAATNQSADLDSFGYITNQTVRKSLAITSPFNGGGSSIWDAVQSESEVSLEVNDNDFSPVAGTMRQFVIGALVKMGRLSI